MRFELDRELKVIHDMLIKMGTLIEEAIVNTIKALKEQDKDLAKKVIEMDDEIDALEEKIEQECISIIALQNPKASDLREITSVLKMITDLERIADHCADIAEYTLKLADETYIKPLVHIPEMADRVKEMVKLTIDCYVKKDVKVAIKVCEMDDIIDEYFDNLVDELKGIMQANQEVIPQCLHFIFIVKYLERMADHATNVCEWIVYNITGKHETLN
ncbi:phosphate signaling complex protein PhoU [Vallitalea okinawensis]|uniref:phosphate signaling complex protein PhoU n=1 Tax=Vallitalea okinawensis TaxID=2078660 RepID=UPI000CFDFB5E|nr:phosphate signaling complex protein PhoU [Vallitalea okinawensis]